LYHTKVKPFNLLHPNSNFAANPEILNVDEIDIVDFPGFNRKYPVSSKHQVNIQPCLNLPFMGPIGLYHPLDDITNPKYKLLHFLTTNFLQREEGTSF
jgi:hypothetical protein